MTIQETIIQIFQETAEENGQKLTPTTSMTIRELGFQSIDWAVIVVKLEQELGFDPFSTGAQFDLNTVQDFINLYTNHPH